MLTATFNKFFDSEKSSGILLIVCTALSLLFANSPIGGQYLSFWQISIGGLTLSHWINDALMAIFFLLIGLELEREVYSGELSSFKDALLPFFAAIGGMLAPALIHFSLNMDTAAKAGIGIPMATDIAFALGVLALLGNRVPASLKVFVVAFAVIDDLGAIIIIAIFYTAKFSLGYFVAAVLLWLVLFLFNRRRVTSLVPYVLGGILLWFLMLQSGVHATIAGVMLAFAIPFSAEDEDKKSPSHTLEHALHKPVAFIIMPIFALANTGIVLGTGWMDSLAGMNSLGIIGGLLLGKPLGVLLFSFVAVGTGLCRLPSDLLWRHVFGAGFLGGIGFTMSIFITNLAFAEDAAAINGSKMAILAASFAAGVVGFLWLQRFSGPLVSHHSTGDSHG